MLPFLTRRQATGAPAAELGVRAAIAEVLLPAGWRCEMRSAAIFLALAVGTWASAGGLADAAALLQSALVGLT